MSEQAPPDDRVGPSFVADERAMLDGWLDFHRRTLLWKCEGLSDEQVKTASVRPSKMTLIGLVRHMSEVERGWFAEFFGTDETEIYCTPDNRDAEWDDIADADVAADLAILRREIETYRELAVRFSLDDVQTDSRGRDINLRWIYTHMIEEYARHNGHADLIRERIDGATGD
jgi:uncharacterized damage-inducible protein DinB